MLFGRCADAIAQSGGAVRNHADLFRPASWRRLWNRKVEYFAVLNEAGSFAGATEELAAGGEGRLECNDHIRARVSARRAKTVAAFTRSKK